MAVAETSSAELEKYLKILRGKPVEASIDGLLSLLKRRQIRGPEQCAVATAHILLQVIAKARFHDVDNMLDRVQQVGCRLVAAQPKELVIANIVRRVLGLIRDEAAEDREDGAGGATPAEEPASPTTGAPETPRLDTTHGSVATYTKQDAVPDSPVGSRRPARPGALTSVSSFTVPRTLLSLLAAAPSEAAGTESSFGRDSGTSTPLRGLKGAQISEMRAEVLVGIEEIKEEINQADDQIASVADVQIHPGDYVLVHQPSPTVQKFIIRAAAKRKFTVLLVNKPGGGPSKEADQASFRSKLAALGISSINIMNGGLMAHMPRVNKVVLGARSILANGGIITDAGSGLVARAAKESGTQVIVLGGVYKLSPASMVDEDVLIEWGGSMAQVSFTDGFLVDGVDVRSAVTEVVPPELVDTYVTNLGAHSRNHLPTLISNHYKQEDVDFQFWNEHGSV